MHKTITILIIIVCLVGCSRGVGIQNRIELVSEHGVDGYFIGYLESNYLGVYKYPMYANKQQVNIYKNCSLQKIARVIELPGKYITYVNCFAVDGMDENTKDFLFFLSEGVDANRLVCYRLPKIDSSDIGIEYDENVEKIDINDPEYFNKLQVIQGSIIDRTIYSLKEYETLEKIFDVRTNMEKLLVVNDHLHIVGATKNGEIVSYDIGGNMMKYTATFDNSLFVDKVTSTKKDIVCIYKNEFLKISSHYFGILNSFSIDDNDKIDKGQW